MNSAKQNQAYLILAYAFFAFYLFGVLFPDAWWGTHFIAFFPPAFKYGLLLLGGALMGLHHYRPDYLSRLGAKSYLPKNRKQWLIVAIVAVVFFRLFPISHDIYGDAPFLSSFAERTVTKPDPLRYELILSPDVLNPKVGERTVLNTISEISLFTGMQVKEIFSWMGAFAGVLFILLWLWFVRTMIKDKTMQNVMAVVGCCAPLTQMFYGHLEIYAPSMVAILAYFSTLVLYFQNGNKKYLKVMGVLLLVCMKLHASALLLLPSFVFTLGYHFFHKNEKIRSRLNWKNMGMFFLLPVFIIGTGAYLFYYQDFADPRFLNENVAEEVERIFLPILAPEAPLDRYTLFHPNHLFDYLNLVVLWSAPALFILICSLTFFRRQINWQKPAVLISGTTLVLYAALFFMVNPLVGMAFDWDLFVMPAPILLVLSVLLIRQVPLEIHAPKLAGTCLGLSLLALPAFMSNVHKEALSHRLESMGIHTYKTYWINGAECINAGVDLIWQSPDEYLQRRMDILKKLQGYAVLGKDSEYAELVMAVGNFHLRRGGDPERALDYFEKANEYYPGYKPILIQAMEAFFTMGDFEEAYKLSSHLVELEYPNKQTATRMAIHCALEAEAYPAAAEHCSSYTSLWPEDKIISSVFENLKNETNLDSLKYMFER